MAAAIASGVFVMGGIALGLELAAKRSSPQTSDGFGKVVSRVEQQVVDFRQQKAAQAAAASAQANQQQPSADVAPRLNNPPPLKGQEEGMSHGQLMRLRSAASKYNIDLNTVSVAASDRVSGEGARLQARQNMAPQSAKYHFQNRPELQGDVAQDMSSQLSFDQVSARNDYEAALNAKYRNEDGQLLNKGGMAQHDFDGETSHYASSGMVQRPRHGAVREARKELTPNSTISDHFQQHSPMTQYQGAQMRREVGVAAPLQAEAPTQVMRGQSRKINPRMNPAAGIAAPDTVGQARVRSDAELYDRNLSEDQVARMISAPPQQTQVVRQDLFENVRDEESAKRLVESPNNMATIIANQQPSSIQNEADSTFKFYTDSGHTEASPGPQEYRPTMTERQGEGVARGQAVEGSTHAMRGVSEHHVAQAEGQQERGFAQAAGQAVHPVHAGVREFHPSAAEDDQQADRPVTTIDMEDATGPQALPALEQKLSMMEQQLASLRAQQSDAGANTTVQEGPTTEGFKEESMVASRVAASADAGTTSFMTAEERQDVTELNGVQPSIGTDSYVTEVAQGGVQQRVGGTE